MALNASTLAGLIKSKRLAALGASGVDNAAMTADCNAIAQAVVEHLLADAVVNPLGLFAPPGTAGGPVTGGGSLT